MKDVGGAVLARSTPPFLGRDDDVSVSPGCRLAHLLGTQCRILRMLSACVAEQERSEILSRLERRWVLLQIPRCDIDGVGEGKCP